MMDSPKRIILDTDLYSDVDDAGALLIAATHEKLKLLAVNVNSKSCYSTLCASAILAHYGHAHTPIGARRRIDYSKFFDGWFYAYGEYATKVAHRWSGGEVPWNWKDDAKCDPKDDAEKALNAAELYYSTLQNLQPGEKVTIVSVGFLDNLHAFLKYEPDSDATPVKELIKDKVSQLIIMGGKYPSGSSWNFRGSEPAAAAYVVAHWPTQIAYVGDDEMGKEVLTGGPLMEATDLPNDPVRQAYIWYTYYEPRSSWDLLAVLFAAEGVGETFEVARWGHNSIDAVKGDNEWKEKPRLNGIIDCQIQLKLQEPVEALVKWAELSEMEVEQMRRETTPGIVAEKLNQLMLEGARDHQPKLDHGRDEKDQIDKKQDDCKPR